MLSPSVAAGGAGLDVGMAAMSSLVTSSAVWLRRYLPWSNSPHAWQERLGLLFAIAAIVIGFLLGSHVNAGWQVLYWGFSLTTVAVLLRRGWLKLFGPVLFYDLTGLARRTRYFLARFLYAMFLLFVVCWVWFVWWSGRQFSGSGGTAEMAGFATTIFNTFVTVQFIIVTFLTPVYTASAIADEKERRTLEFLLATDLRNREIVLSKLLARFLNLGMLVLAGLPILGILQFLGGIDPGLVLASYAATLATVASLACLGTLFSVLVRKARDAILLTYLGVVAYFIGYILTLVASSLSSTWTTFPSFGTWQSPVTLGDLADWYNAGNIIDAIFVRLNYFSGRTGATVSDALPGVLRSYLVFHCALALFCAVWAVLRLRAVALREAYGRSQRARLGVRVMGRPSVGNQPIVWKEVYAEPGLRLHWFGRVLVILLIGASFLPAAIILWYYVQDSYGPWRRGASYLADAMNVWARIAGTAVACLLLLGVAMRAAGSITGERDRQTFDSLLTSPVDSNAILYGKWLGSVLSMRRGWLWLGSIYGISVITGGVNPVGAVLVVCGWLVLAGFVAILGLWFSTSCRSTMRATVWTILTLLGAFGGHWLIWMCCGPLLIFSRQSPSAGFEDTLQHGVEFQLFGLTPPVTLGLFAFRAEDFDHYSSHWNPVVHFIMGIIGLGFWAGFGGAIWSATSGRLQVLTMRTRFRQADGLSPLPRRAVSSRHALVEDQDILTVEPVSDDDLQDGTARRL
jgi:ABC-type transport system involved in multi-copper enzyme maturation permease subunit